MLNKLELEHLHQAEVDMICSRALITQSLECEWYGQLYCSGDIIIDLYSWKFLKKCADGKMGVYGRSWQEVSQDPRFKVISE